MGTLLTIARWLLGVFLLFVALGSMINKEFLAALIMVAGVFVLLPPSAARLARLGAPVAGHGAAIGIGLILFFAGAAVPVITSDTKAPTVANAPAVNASATKPAPVAPYTLAAPKPTAPDKVDVGAKISPNAAMLIEGGGWDKTRRAWGSAGVKRLNATMPKVAEKVAQASGCDYVELVGLSDRSNPKTLAVFFVDCRNGQRFYVSEDDLKSDDALVSKNAKTAAISDGKAISACENRVKSQLRFPLSFDRDLLNTSVYRAPTGNLAIEFTFQAKNALGAELPQRARCVIDDTGIHPAEITNG